MSIKVLNLTRVFDAPRDLVFKAWTDPVEVAKWWGPRGFGCPRCNWDARVGGVIDLDMVGFEIAHPMTGEFLEVSPPNRLVFLAKAFVDENGNSLLEIHNTVTFEEKEGKTQVTLRAEVTKAAPGTELALGGMDQGWSESLDKLAELVGNTSDGEIRVSRSYDAPRNLVWDVWTQPEHVTQWWGPDGFTTTVQQMDVIPGGMWLHTMHGPDGRDYLNKVKYLDVLKPERLVYQQMGDSEDEPAGHKSIVIFKELGGKTDVFMKLIFDSAEEMARIVREHGADEGAKQHMANLAAYLEKLQ